MLSMARESWLIEFMSALVFSNGGRFVDDAGNAVMADPQKGAQKALYFRMGAFMLNPGLVGLHVVDAFCAGLVMVTTTGARHSPEVCYLRDGINGLMTHDDPADYAQRVLTLIQDPAALARLRAASLADADVYTLDQMVANFADGIERCLDI